MSNFRSSLQTVPCDYVDQIEELLVGIKRYIDNNDSTQNTFSPKSPLVSLVMDASREIVNVHFLMMKDDMLALNLFEIILMQIIKAAGRLDKVVVLQKIGEKENQRLQLHFRQYFRSERIGPTGSRIFMCADFEKMRSLSRNELGIGECTAYDKANGLVHLVRDVFPPSDVCPMFMQQPVDDDQW